jgi:hypothetical protein
MHNSTAASVILAMALSAGAAKAADQIPYPNSGAYNTTTYTFTAAATGDLMAYIVGGFGASYDNQLGLLVNGVQQGGFALDNHTSALGDSVNFGPVTAGDSLIFILHNVDLDQNAYSLATMNAAYDEVGYTGGGNHIYSTVYNADPAIASAPVGTYVGFEDIPYPGADFNYNDESFVFTNTATVVMPNGGGVPEPATWALMLTGFFGAGAALRRRPRALIA